MMTRQRALVLGIGAVLTAAGVFMTVNAVKADEPVRAGLGIALSTSAMLITTMIGGR